MSSRAHPQYLHSMLTSVIFYNRVSHILIAPATFRADQEKRQSCGYCSLKIHISYKKHASNVIKIIDEYMKEENRRK